MTASAEDTATLLGRVPVFAELARDDLERVAERRRTRGASRAGEVVFREGDDSDTCYVVRSGHARAIREHPDGRQITLATFGPGDIFGELAMFDDERRSATVEAIDDARGARRSSAPTCAALMLRHPELAVKLVDRARPPAAGDQRAARAASPSRPCRAAWPPCSPSSSSRRAPRARAQRDVPITATQADLAKLAGSSRESA